LTRTISFPEARAAFAAGASAGDEELRRAALATLESASSGPDVLHFLVEAMGDESWRVRKEAAAAAARLPDRQTVAVALVVALGEPDNVGRRNAAIEALEAVGSSAVQPLLDSLATLPEHRKVVLDTLGLLADPSASRAVAASLGDVDPNVRMAATEALGRIGGAEAQEALRGLLATVGAMAGGAAPPGGERLLMLTALDALNRTGARLSLDLVLPLLEIPTMRAVTLAALARTGDRRAAEHLVRYVADPARSIAGAALRGLDELSQRLGRDVRGVLGSLPAGAMNATIRAVVDGEPTVQRAAVRVLGWTGDLAAVPPLTLALGQVTVAEEAGAALAELGPDGVHALLALLPNLDVHLRAEVFRQLPRLLPAPDATVLSLLAGALGDDDGELATSAAEALSSVGGPDSLGPLVAALGRNDPAAAAAASALGRLGQAHYDLVRVLVTSRGLEGPEATQLLRVMAGCGRAADLPWLRAGLGLAASEVRRAAADAMQAVRRAGAAFAREDGEALLFGLTDEDALVRAAAARALGADGLVTGSVEALARTAADPAVVVRTAAARALGEIAASTTGAARGVVLTALRRLADAPDPGTVVPALEGLGALGDPADDGRLLGGRRVINKKMVKAAARALGQRAQALSAHEARDALAAALRDPRWDVRQAVATALAAHGPSVHPVLYAARLRETDPSVQQAIDDALGRSLNTSESPGPRKP